MNKKNNRRLKSIDFLRGIAIILVLFSHYEIVTILTKVGWVGVDLFFVISGFLVSGLLFKEYIAHGSLRPGYFLIRRGIRIYPLFYLFLISVVLLKYISGDIISDQALIGEVFFLQNYIGRIMGHTWSLAVEEHFYIAIALLFYILCKLKPSDPFRYLTHTFIIVSTIILSWRIFNFTNNEYTFQTHHYYSHLRADSLFFGVLLAYFYNIHNIRFRGFFDQFKNQLLILLSIGLSIPFIYEIDTFFINTFGLTILYFSFGLLLILCMLYVSFENNIRILQLPIDFVTLIGYYSYSIYLFHLPVKYAWIPVSQKIFGFENEIAEFFGYAGLSLLVGVISAKLVELPMLKLGAKYFPSRASGLSVSPVQPNSS